MPEFFIFYLESTIICLIIFGIMLIHDLANMDRQEKQVKFDRALVVFMLYFVSDLFCVGVENEVIEQTKALTVLFNLSNCILMAGITYMWLAFVMAVEKTPHRNRKINQFAIVFPFLVSTVLLIVVYLVAPDRLLSNFLEVQPLYYVFLIAVPCINIAAILFYTVKRARKEESRIEKRRHLYLGFFPLTVVVGGIVQIIFLPNTPIFCFCCVILMLILYIHSMETRISVDALTGLNNRGQMIRFLSQKSNYSRKDKPTFAVMIDINGFKKINDTYGHAEGDQALIILADVLKEIAKNYVSPIFLCRYGGDEFLLIVHPNNDSDIASLISTIRRDAEDRCRMLEKPYLLSVGAGYEKYATDHDTIQKCIQRADKNLYIDKGRSKR